MRRVLDILPYPFCGNTDIEPSRYDVDIMDDKDGNTLYDIRMIMNCGECNMHMIGPDGVADSMDDAESAARDGLIPQWNTRWIPDEGDGRGLAH